jgi:hypothetical protein
MLAKGFSGFLILESALTESLFERAVDVFSFGS